MILNMDFKHSSEKAWNLLKKLSGGTLNMNITTGVTPNQITSRLVSSAKMPINSKVNSSNKSQIEKCEYQNQKFGKGTFIKGPFN